MNSDGGSTRHLKFNNVYFFIEGLFGAHMMVGLENDGPVTLSLESQSTTSEAT